MSAVHPPGDGCIGGDYTHGIRYHVWDWRHRSWEVGVCCDLTGGGFWEAFCFKILRNR